MGVGQDQLASKVWGVEMVKTLAFCGAVALATTVAQLVGAVPARADGAGGSYRVISVSPAGAPGDNSSSPGFISADLRFIGFQSQADNLVPAAGDQPNGVHVYVADTVAGTISQVDLTAAGSGLPEGAFMEGMSPDGRYVAYADSPTNNAVYFTVLVDRVTGTTTRPCGAGDCSWITFSDDDQYMAFATYNSGTLPGNFGERHVYLYGLQSRSMSLLDPGTPSGHCAAFNAQFGSDHWVYWDSCGTNLVPGAGGDHDDLFRRNIDTSQIQVLDTTTAGVSGNGDVNGFNVSADGRYVAFDSLSTNLVPGDADGQWRPYLKDLQTGSIVAVARHGSGPGYVTTVGALYETDGGFTADDSLLICTQDPLLFPQGAGGGLRHPDGSLQWLGRSCAYRMSPDATRYVLSVAAMPDGTPTHGGQIAIAITPWSDTTPPVVIGVPDRQPNAAGWYNAPVTVTWTAADPAPSSGTPTTPPAVVAVTEGTAVTVVSQPSCDPAGNCGLGTYGPIDIDMTPPAVIIGGISAGATYRAGQAPPATCTASDSLSGLAAPCTVSITGATRTDPGPSPPPRPPPTTPATPVRRRRPTRYPHPPRRTPRP